MGGPAGNQAVIGIGSNIEPASNVAKALAEMARRHRIIAQSQLVWTAPIGPAQPDFLNGVVRIETDLDMPELIVWLKSLESRLGRVRGGDKFGPRTIDLDVVVWNGRIVDDDFHSREFLRKSVLEVWPELSGESR